MPTMQEILAAIKADPEVLAAVVNGHAAEAPVTPKKTKAAPIPKKTHVDSRCATFVGWIKTLAKANVNSAGKQYSKGVHSRFSGIMDVAQGEFGVDRETMIGLIRSWCEAGLMAQHPSKGGFMLYAAGDAPASGVSAEQRAEKARMLLGL